MAWDAIIILLWNCQKIRLVIFKLTLALFSSWILNIRSNIKFTTWHILPTSLLWCHLWFLFASSFFYFVFKHHDWRSLTFEFVEGLLSGWWQSYVAWTGSTGELLILLAVNFIMIGRIKRKVSGITRHREPALIAHLN